MEDMELRRACAAAIASTGAKEEVVFSIRVAKGRGIFEKLGRLAKPRVLALTCMSPFSFQFRFLFRFSHKTCCFLFCTCDGIIYRNKREEEFH